MNNDKDKIPVNVFGFDELVQKTIKTSQKLMEYFRLHFIYYQLVSGKGLEFDRIREYQPGMDSKRIDWKIFARTGKLFIRSYKEERELNIIIILDVSDTMLLGTNNYTKNQYASVIAGILAFAANEAGDNVGGGVFSDRVQILLDNEPDFIPLLHTLSQKQNYGGKKQWSKLATELIANYDSNSIIFIISDFLDTNANVFLPELAVHFAKVYGIMINDPIDVKIPDKVSKVYIKDPQTKNVILADLGAVKEEYELLAKRRIERLKNIFHHYGQMFFYITTGEDFSISFIKAMGDEEVEIS